VVISSKTNVYIFLFSINKNFWENQSKSASSVFMCFVWFAIHTEKQGSSSYC
jgi:hypothetical protein